MSEVTFYWETASRRGPSTDTETAEIHLAHQLGPALAALRRGLGREAGDVPQMWPFYRALGTDGRVTDRLRAEHATLALFGLHQQSQSASVHVPGRRLGQALGELRRSARYSEQALDSRFTQAATAESPGEAAYHLRGLIQQLKAAHIAGFDYTDLFRGLRAWDHPERRGRVRRIWAADYYRRGAAIDNDQKESR
ncbi:MAG: type I-E CRISPR-associated protein Cse2/CasB [Dermatophilaceae bacterium]